MPDPWLTSKKALPSLDWMDCSLVEINPLKLSDTPVLSGTRMLADAILGNYSEGCSVEEIAEVFDVPAAGVRALLTWAAQKNLAIFL